MDAALPSRGAAIVGLAIPAMDPSLIPSTNLPSATPPGSHPLWVTGCPRLLLRWWWRQGQLPHERPGGAAGSDDGSRCLHWGRPDPAPSGAAPPQMMRSVGAGLHAAVPVGELLHHQRRPHPQGGVSAHFIKEQQESKPLCG